MSIYHPYKTLGTPNFRHSRHSKLFDAKKGLKNKNALFNLKFPLWGLGGFLKFKKNQKTKQL